ncbi:hypothetical protein Bsph_3062 [Lysinibacillus sphaericus C3-41]|uniref:Uncharacterized protein n=1 Tax=Lysinibacillus sphaericus (strain C3-41) TaxID=444177 RepID=B1HPD1_LYSSC|nr:hypothetical protein Bsph_3062 [Lysinibacillus sphaericus C3-41]
MQQPLNQIEQEIRGTDNAHSQEQLCNRIRDGTGAMDGFTG